MSLYSSRSPSPPATRTNPVWANSVTPRLSAECHVLEPNSIRSPTCNKRDTNGNSVICDHYDNQGFWLWWHKNQFLTYRYFGDIHGERIDALSQCGSSQCWYDTKCAGTNLNCWFQSLIVLFTRQNRIGRVENAKAVCQLTWWPWQHWPTIQWLLRDILRDRLDSLNLRSSAQMLSCRRIGYSVNIVTNSTSALVCKDCACLHPWCLDCPNFQIDVLVQYWQAVLQFWTLRRSKWIGCPASNTKHERCVTKSLRPVNKDLNVFSTGWFFWYCINSLDSKRREISAIKFSVICSRHYCGWSQDTNQAKVL